MNENLFEPPRMRLPPTPRQSKLRRQSNLRGRLSFVFVIIGSAGVAYLLAVLIIWFGQESDWLDMAGVPLRLITGLLWIVGSFMAARLVR
jgi:hypothetical protein